MISQLPDPELEHGVDPIRAYIAGLEDRVERLRKLCRARYTQARYDALTKAIRDVRRAHLDHYGIDCPACKGAGYVSNATYGLNAAADCEMFECPHPDCKGTGIVLPAEAERWIQQRGEG